MQLDDKAERRMMRLLFVDAEKEAVQFRSTLPSEQNDWSMKFASSGPEALQILANEPFDVVVADSQMRDPDGAQLLEAVKTRYPHTLRIALSGQSGRKSSLRSLSPSHQLLSKPCNAEKLRDRIAKAFALRDLLENSAIKEVVSGLETIPSLPAIYEEAIQELESRDASITRVAAIVSKDAAMTAKILQLANSALVGASNVTSAAQAVGLIGLDTIKALVVSVQIFSHFERQKIGDIDLPQLWRHSVATASTARAVAQFEKSPKGLTEDCFTAGLLHDVGKLVFIGSLPAKYKSVITQAVKDNAPLLEAERDTFNCTHAEVGAYLIAIWGLPHRIVEAVAWHHFPSMSGEHQSSPVTAVHVANAFLSEGEFSHLPAKSVLDNKHFEQTGLSERIAAWQQLCQDNLYRFKLEAGQ